MSNKKFVKLGEKASSFYDVTSGLKLANQDVKEYKKGHKKSKRVTRALRAGHLVWAEEEEFDAFEKFLKSGKKEDLNISPKKSKEEEEDEETVPTHKELMKKSKTDLIDLAKESGSELDDEDFEGLNKSDIADEIIELLEEE